MALQSSYINGKLQERKLNLMLVISSLSGAGAELVVANLCRNLNHELFNISICHLRERGERGETLLQEGYDIVPLPENRFGKAGYFSFLALSRLIRAKKIDMLHSHDRASLYDCASAKLFTPGVKLMHTYHFGNYPHVERKHLLLEGIFSRVADRLVAVGYNQKNQITDALRIRAGHIATVYNGIEPLQIDEKEEEFSDAPLLIGAMSTFIKQKGLEYLLEIAQSLKGKNENVLFWVAGDGPLRKEIEEKKRKMQLDDIVHFLGWIPNAGREFLPSIDIFIQTSLWEAMSIAILEAMSAAKPVVATDVGENRAIIEGAESGFIVSPGDTKYSVAHLKGLIADESLRRHLGENGRKAVESFYTVQIMAKRYEDLYSNTLGM